MRTLALVICLVALTVTSALAASSEDNRDDSLIFVGVSPFGITAPHIIGALVGSPYLPVSAGVYLGSHFLIAGEYGFMSVDAEEDQAGDSEFKGEFTNLGIYARIWPGTNSFNFLVAVRQRTWDIDARVDIVDDTTGFARQVGVSLDADATVATLGIGNQWVTDFGLTIGLDWLVVSGLIDSSTSGKIDAAELNTLAPADVAEAEQELEDVGDALNEISALPGFLVLTIGWSF